MMWKKISDWWAKAWLEGEDIEYYRYLQRHPVRADFIRGKTKAELAQELHDWQVRSTEQGITIDKMKKECLQEIAEIQQHYIDASLAMADFYRSYTRHNPNDLPNPQLPRQAE